MKKDISQLDWNALDLPVLKANHAWVLPQVLAFFNHVVRLQKNSGDTKISVAATLRALHADLLEARVKFQTGRAVTARELTRLLQYVNHAPRGEILAGTQTATENARYSAAVPLLLSAFKEYRDVPYSAWDYADPAIAQFLDKDLQELIPHMDKSYDDFDLLAFRETGRTQKAGKNPGRQKSYVACTAITGVDDPDFKKLPRLLKLQLCQCWVYHPTIRHPLAWTDLQNLDQYATPLVDVEVLTAPETPTTYRLPWDTGEPAPTGVKTSRKAKPQPELQKLPWQ